ncbi:hypothetical protein WBG78_23895 [Chryseolinea sp. T2]|uniref:hypothetical protein n=1 Tax=Chryseolinea sp. T2 TaxID=3129255 RepID=UPI003076E49B
MLKFFFGPLGGYAAGLTLLTTILTTVAGMMTVVLVFAFFGTFIRQKIVARFMRRKRRFTPKNRRLVRIWQRFGIFGVAILTPVLFTPIVGAAIAVSFGVPRQTMILHMFISASIWSVLVSVIVYVFGQEIVTRYFN